MRRWNKASDIPTERRAEKVLRTLGWEMQVEFEHLSEAQLASPQYLDHILQIIEMKAGVREDDDKRAAFKSVLHENGRRKDESLSQYVSRRIRDFTKAATYGVQLPEEFRAALLREGAGLNDQGLQNLTALLQGDDHRVDRVAQVLARIDTRQDRITGFVYSSEEHQQPEPTSWLAADAGGPEDFQEEPSGDEDDETDEDHRVLAELTELNFSQEQAALVFAIVENRMPRPKRTWKENKRFKQELRKDRRSFVKGPPDDRPHDRAGEGSGGAGRPRLSKEQLKKISKCRICGRRGHWAEDCRSRGPPRPEAGAKLSNFCYLGGSLSGAANGFTGVVFSQEAMEYKIEYGENKVTFDPTWCFLTIPSGMAILDIGATQDIIGVEAFAALERELSRCGLQAVEIPTTARAPTGIGGAAKVARTMLVPISPGGVPGVIQFLVIEQNIPPLLSVGFLEHLGTAMDLTTNMVSFQTIGVDMKMVNLPSGHRAVPLVEWAGGDFPVPQVVKEQHGLNDGAFAKISSVPSAYIKKSEARICRVSDNVEVNSDGCNRSVHAERQQQFMNHTSVGHMSASQCDVSDHDQLHAPPTSGSIAPMGNQSTSCSPQFERVALGRDHGTTVSHDGGLGNLLRESCGEEWKNHSAVAEHRGQDVLPAGEYQGKVCQAGGGGDTAKEPPLRKASLFADGCAEAGRLPTPWTANSKSQPVRHVDGVPEVLGPVDLHVQAHSAERKGEGKGTSKWISSTSRTRGGSGTSAYKNNEKLGIHGASTDGAGAPRARHHLEGHDDELPRGGRLPPRAGQGTRADVDDDAGPVPQHDREYVPGPGHPGRRGHRGSGDGLGIRVSGGRQPGELVPCGQPECRRPATVRWPRWMMLPMLTLTSSLLSWDQLSGECHSLLRGWGHSEGAWILHHSSGTSVPRGEEPSRTSAPSWAKAPWIRVREGPAGSDEDAVWHEVQKDGMISSRGPGPVPSEAPETATVRTWCCPRSLRALQESVDVEKIPVGFDEQGEPCTRGPFWAVTAPTLTELLTGGSDAALEDKRDLEAGRAENSFMSMAQQVRRHQSGSQVDVVNLFETTLQNATARAAGLRVSAAHEDFTRQGEWSSARKEHRQRFRHFMRHRRPEVLLVSLPEILDSREAHVRHRVDVAFALEALKMQLEDDKRFYLEASPDDELWSSAEWRVVVDRGDVRVGGSEDRTKRCATNLDLQLKAAVFPNNNLSSEGSQECFHEAPKSRKPASSPNRPLSSEWESLSPGEKLAYRLREKGDLSHSSCVELLRITEWPARTSRRLSVQTPGAYQILGQYSYGRFAGITLGTYKLKFTTLYLNDFLTAQGASGSRSSISITQNAAVRPHRDAHNVCLNYCIALGKFKGGDLWVEDPEGTIHKKLKSGAHVAGKVMKHQGRLNVFDPKKYHAVEKYEGERWSITAFTTRSSQGLSQGQQDHLESFGFSLQGYEGSPTLPGGAVQDLCCAITAVSAGASGSSSSFPTAPIDEILDPGRGENTETEDEDQEDEHETTEVPEAKLTESQKRLVRKLHENTGHPPKERFLRTLRAAGALPHVLKYIRDVFECETCAAKRLPDHRRKGQCPRVHAFNRVLSMDVFYVPVKGSSVPILNVVCHGTNYQVAHRISGTGGGTPSSSATWKAFLSTWVRFLGPPSMVITDGGKEFQGRFERGVEQLGTLHHVTAPDSPWQNSRAERHGGWLKQRMIQELESGQSVIENLEDLDELLAATTAAKNRWFCSGGYTPVQLVFGEMPRVPGELLSDNPSGLQPLCDAFNDPAGLDEAGAELRRSMAIRERGRQLALAETSREAFKRAARTSSTPVRTWNPGQWVFCFRRGRPNDALHPVSRWVGPGIVVLQSPSVVYVAMRTRLWRCAPEQLRPAFPPRFLAGSLRLTPS